MLFLFSVSGSKSPCLSPLCSVPAVFSKSLSRFSPPEFNPFPYSLMKDPFPRFCKFSSVSGSPGFNLTPLFLFPPPAVIFLAAQSFPSARRFKPRCILFFSPLLARSAAMPRSPFLVFSASALFIRFPTRLSAFPSALRVVCSRSVPSPAAARASCSFLRVWFRFSLSARFSVFQTQALPFLFRPTFSGCLLICFPPRPWFSRRFVRFECTKKGRQLPAPIFIYIKNFPMYP